MGRAYGVLLADRSLLRLQLHAFAACDDPEVRDVVRAAVRRPRGPGRGSCPACPPGTSATFFAEGMLLNVAAAMDLTEADVAWQRICEEGMRSERRDDPPFRPVR